VPFLVGEDLALSASRNDRKQRRQKEGEEEQQVVEGKNRTWTVFGAGGVGILQGGGGRRILGDKDGGSRDGGGKETLGSEHKGIIKELSREKTRCRAAREKNFRNEENETKRMLLRMSSHLFGGPGLLEKPLTNVGALGVGRKAGF